jgi:ribosomal protein L16 Arg81 hydroxylase
MTIDQHSLNDIVARMISPKEFFSEYWGKRPVYLPKAALECIGLYSTEDFLRDAIAGATSLLAISVERNERAYARPKTREELYSAVEAGGVAPVRISQYWHEPGAPANWAWMRALFGTLCRAASMIYMSPPRSENVDLFFAGPRSHLGVHYDTSHTFTVQLSGQRKWVVEDAVRLDEKLANARDPDFSPNDELPIVGTTIEVTLQPGDALYVPAYCVHGVTGVTWSVSLGLGLRAFNEIDFVARLLEVAERTSYIEFPPVESFPASTGELHVQAKLEFLKRVRALLKQLEAAAVGSVMAPLRLPETLAPLDSARFDSVDSGYVEQLTDTSNA